MATIGTGPGAPIIPPVPFNYTNRDYVSLRESLVLQLKNRIPAWEGHNDPNDFALALLESFAYAVDGLHYYLDRIANEAFAATAVRPESVRAMTALVGYRPAKRNAATVTLEFRNLTPTPTVIPQGTVVQTSMATDMSLKPTYFETSAEVTVGPNSKAEVTAVEGYTVLGDDKNGEMLGISSGQAWQAFTLPLGPVLHGSVRVMIQYTQGWTQEWTQVEDIRAAPAQARVFQVQAYTNDAVRILFGSGASGAIPAAGSAIKAIYRVGGGFSGNVEAHTLTVISGDTALALSGTTVTNHYKASGGADEESIESIRNNILWRGTAAPDKAVSLDDFDQVALTYAGVGKVRSYAHESASVMVAVGPVDDGTNNPGETTVNGKKVPTAAMQALVAGVRTTLRNSAFAGAVVDVKPPTYREVEIKIDITLHDNEVLPRYREALYDRLRRMFAYDTVQFGMNFKPYDIVAAFSSSGVAEVVVTTLRLKGDASAPQVGEINLQPYEIPWISAAGSLNVKASTGSTSTPATAGITRTTATRI